MEQRRAMPQEYDFRQHDRIWQRVSPGLIPYPDLRTEGASSTELRLPGAEANPCCLGSVAEESIPVLEGFLEEEQQALALERSLLRCAPTSMAATVLERLVKGGEDIRRRLSAVIFLVEGYWVEKEQMLPRPRLRGFEEGLRTAYHLEICGAQNYERAAEGTTDACLSRILRQFAQEKYTRADRILKLLSQHCR